MGDESRRHYPKVWQGGVDRWYGQNMTDDQLSFIQYYHDQTPICDLPQWVHGLMHYYSGKQNKRCSFMQWDYGLTQDMQLLCGYRRGPLPFLAPEDLWGRSEGALGR